MMCIEFICNWLIFISPILIIMGGIEYNSGCKNINNFNCGYVKKICNITSYNITLNNKGYGLDIECNTFGATTFVNNTTIGAIYNNNINGSICMGNYGEYINYTIAYDVYMGLLNNTIDNPIYIYIKSDTCIFNILNINEKIKSNISGTVLIFTGLILFVIAIVYFIIIYIKKHYIKYDPFRIPNEYSPLIISII